MMRVIHVIGGGEFGGAEEHILRLLSRLPDFGFRGKVMCFYEADLSKALREKGIEVEVLDYGRFDARLVSALRNVFLRDKPHIIHTHGVKANFFARLAARHMHHIPLITTVHSMLRFDYLNKATYMAASGMEQFTRRFNDHYIAVSEAIREELMKSGIIWNRISVVHHGIDYGEFAEAEGTLRAELGLPDDALVIGAVTRLVKIKGIDHVIRAFVRIHDKYPRAHLVIVGTGPEEAELKQLVRERRLENHVHFAGFRRDIPACLHSFDYFISASLTEGLGLNVMEAMAAGVPVVATGVGGIRDFLVDRRNGLEIRPSSEEAIAGALLELIENPRLADALRTEAQRHVKERFSIHSMVSRTADIYNMLWEAGHE